MTKLSKGYKVYKSTLFLDVPPEHEKLFISKVVDPKDWEKRLLGLRTKDFKKQLKQNEKKLCKKTLKPTKGAEKWKTLSK